MREIYLIRHGETEWSQSGKHTGLSDIPLTEKGENQAAVLGRRLKKISFDHVFSSPLKRAKDTCIISGFDPQYEKALYEWDYGAYEGLKSSVIHETQPKWNVFTHGAPGGESVEDVKKRASRFLKKLESLEGNIALFSSGHILRVFAMVWLELSMETGRRFPLTTASLSLLGYEHQTPALKLWNDISHHKE